MYTPLSGMTKTLIATTIAGGIAIAGITWQGDGSITNIQGNLDHMKQELTEAINDNTFLKGQIDNFKGVVQETSLKVGVLEDEKAALEAQIAELQAQLEEEGNLTEEQAALQNEVNRLEGELDRANQQIHELETYAAAADSQEYEPIDQAQYAAPFVAIEPDAYALDAANAEKMASEDLITTIEQEFVADLNGSVNITGVTTYTENGTEYLAYSTDSWNGGSGTTYPQSIIDLANELGYPSVFFVDAEGVLVGRIPPN